MIEISPGVSHVLMDSATGNSQTKLSLDTELPLLHSLLVGRQKALSVGAAVAPHAGDR